MLVDYISSQQTNLYQVNDLRHSFFDRLVVRRSIGIGMGSFWKEQKTPHIKTHLNEHKEKDLWNIYPSCCHLWIYKTRQNLWKKIPMLVRNLSQAEKVIGDESNTCIHCGEVKRIKARLFIQSNPCTSSDW